MRVKNQILNTLFNLHGNQRVTIFIQPLFGLPYSLYIPFQAMYMARLGLDPLQIGTVSTVNILSQMLSSIFGGVLADKLGRRRCLFIVDFFAWCLPFLLWAFAQNYITFLLAGIFNGMWRIGNVSYNLLLIEDSPKESWLNLFSLSNITNLLAGFVAPLAFFIVKRHGLVSSMRALYLSAFVLLVIKNTLMYRLCYDSDISKRRKEEAKNTGIFSSLYGARHILLSMLKNKRILFAMLIMSCHLAIKSNYDNFWPLFICEKLGLAEESLSLFNTIRSIVIILFTIFMLPSVARLSFKKPMLLATSVLSLSSLIYLTLPHGSMLMVLILSLLDAFGLAILVPVVTNIEAAQLDDENRAKMASFSASMSLIITAPIGIFAGCLSRMNQSLPLYLTIIFSALALVLSLRLSQMQEKACKN